ncbi:hypothetical protein PV729_26775 [Streptomyces europaeiscabiei]|uniref:Toxic anion resistance protein n=1 Tax=Streptomyces europaeiscabiei TaxID=146819 RepID=A0ABU4NRL6_9ACTN|nr:hypothetical protein [Streptomyces europaeiscabiei]MDX3555327.1 hypothetical protein [Streptomyces europaeiscabiei]MDX3705341.1 hypothetical protein [Streptomyces europaeiscabiei]
MTDSPAFTGTGAEDDPLTFTLRESAPDPVDVAVASMAKSAKEHSAAFSATADLSANLPADVREIVTQASIRIGEMLSTAYDARAKADSFLNDVRLYPEGRKVLAGEAIKAAADKVAETSGQADAQIEVAAAQTYEAARPRVASDAAMTARADLAMLTQRHVGNAGALVATLKRLAQRSDSVGALVADTAYLGDFLDAYGADPQLREAAMTVVRAEVIKAAALSGDPKRAAAGKTNLALNELRKARIAAQSFTRHVLG